MKKLVSSMLLVGLLAGAASASASFAMDPDSLLSGQKNINIPGAGSGELTLEYLKKTFPEALKDGEDKYEEYLSKLYDESYDKMESGRGATCNGYMRYLPESYKERCYSHREKILKVFEYLYLRYKASESIYMRLKSKLNKYEIRGTDTDRANFVNYTYRVEEMRENIRYNLLYINEDVKLGKPLRKIETYMRRINETVNDINALERFIRMECEHLGLDYRELYKDCEIIPDPKDIIEISDKVVLSYRF